MFAGACHRLRACPLGNLVYKPQCKHNTPTRTGLCHSVAVGRAAIGAVAEPCCKAPHRVYVKLAGKLTHMTKTQVYLPDEDLEALRSVGKRTGRSVADLVREAVRRVWLRPDSSGPVALWDGSPAQTSLEHDAIYDEA